MVQRLTLPIRHIRTICDNTVEFGLDSSSTNFSFQNGQYISVVLPEVEATDKSSYHEFSLSSPASSKTLTFTFRKSDSSFKQALLKKKVGEQLDIEGPFGAFYPKTMAQDLFFITGGIGITPFRSILSDLPHDHTNTVTLITFNTAEKTAPYQQEMRALSHENTFLLQEHFGPLQLTPSDIDPSPNVQYFIAGPNEFVKSARQSLLDLGILEESIQTEEFTGYE